MGNDADFAAQVVAARQWSVEISDRLKAGTWVPTADQRQLCADIARAAWRPSAALPPHTDEPLYVRVHRISVWAAVIRLAVRAGGWTLTEPTDEQPHAADPEVVLPGLLTALYPVAGLAEHWCHACDHAFAAASGDSGRDDLRVLVEFPHLAEQLADAERIFDGYGGVREVFGVIATGEVD
jgi:hypothetical protein